MAIKVNGYNAIDDSRNMYLRSIQFADGTTQTSDVIASSNITTTPGGSLLQTINYPQFLSQLSSNGDRFGVSVAVSGNYAIVGAYREDDADGNDSGKAYIFNVTTGALVWTLNNPSAYSTGFDDEFGYSVAISGNYAIVSAINESDAGGYSSGKVYIYNVTTGALLYTLNNPNAYSTSRNDYFGYSVAISGNYAIVGANWEGDAGGAYSGKAYIFDVTTGLLLWTLDNPNAYGTSAGDGFGDSVAVSGNYAIVGASYEADVGGNSSGKAYIFNVTTGALVWTLDNPNAYSTSENDRFGWAVAISGNYAAVGAINESDTSGIYSGKAYIYNVTTGALLFTLNDPNAYSTSTGDRFGYSVAISGNYAIVGAPEEADVNGIGSGKAYIYNVTTGALLFTLNNPNAYGTSSYDYFGNSVAVSGNYAIIGAYQEADASGSQSGKAYIYNVTTGVRYLTIDNPNKFNANGASSYHGRSVAISGNYAIVGAHGEDDISSPDSGKAYIYNVTTGELVWALDNPNAYSTITNDNFGLSVAISGNYAAVGAINEDDASGISSGKAYIFNVTTGQLVCTLNNPNAYSTSVFDSFSNSLAISGNYAIVTAWGEDQASTGSGSGKAYIFNVTTGQLIWTLNNPNAYSTSQDDNFGTSVAISGNYAILGANNEDAADGLQSGKAYIYNVTTGALVHTLNNPNAYSTGLNDNFGFSVGISGNYAIVGAFNEDDASGTTSGKVYIYNVTTGALLWTLNNPTAYSTGADDNFGYSVAISGNYAIVGAGYEDDESGTTSGKVYIYNVTTGALLYTLNNPNAYGTGAGDYFGQPLAISGNYVIVSAYNEDDISGIGLGKAYIFNVNKNYTYNNPIVIGGYEKLVDANIYQTSYAPYVNPLKFVLGNPNAYSTGASDGFGQSVAISGNYAIVGAGYEDDASGASSGKAYIYNVTTGALLWTLNNPNDYSTGSYDYFGSSVGISSNYAIVGAWGEDDPGGVDSGKAYIYNVTTGQLIWTLTNPNAYSTSADDEFGASVAISGNYAIVGAGYEDDITGTVSGKAYIYNVATGAIVWILDNPNAYGTGLNDIFGISVAISGNYAMVSAAYEDTATGLESGKVYIYNVTTGALLFTLNNPNAYGTTEFDYFGSSIAISGNYAIVGAYQEDDATGSSSGKAYIYNVTNGLLMQTLHNPNTFSTGEYDNFGISVAISGNYAIVSADEEDSAGPVYNTGKVYIYNVTTGELLYTLNNPNAYGTGADDYFGTVAISDNYVIVGVANEDDASGTSSGKAYIYDIRQNSPTRRLSVEDKLISLFAQDPRKTISF
jgi:outer membrane protein assembly factor BamB